MSALSRVLILGHSGLIGARVVDQFRRRSPGVELILRSLPEFDLADPACVGALAGDLAHVGAVILLAGIKRQVGDSLDVLETNLRMVGNFLRAAERQPVARLVYVSSGAVYGEELHDLAIRESTPVQPVSYYGIAKYTSERLLENLAARHPATALVCVRPPLVYGPGDASRSYGPAGFVRAALEGREIVIWGDGLELREFLYVDDLAALLHDLVFLPCRGVLNAAGGRSRTFQDILRILQEECGGRLAVTARPRSKQKVDNAYDITRLRELLPGFVFTSLEEGLRRTLRAEHAALTGPGSGPQTRG